MNIRVGYELIGIVRQEKTLLQKRIFKVCFSHLLALQGGNSETRETWSKPAMTWREAALS